MHVDELSGRSAAEIKRFYAKSAFSDEYLKNLKFRIGDGRIEGICAEFCFYFVSDGEVQLAEEDLAKVRWFLGETFDDLREIGETSFFEENGSKRASNHVVLEFGPKLSFTTAYSTNAVSALQAAGLTQIRRVEKSVRYSLTYSTHVSTEEVEKIYDFLHDRMTEIIYLTPPKTFDLHINPPPYYEIDVMGRGIEALEEFNQKFGLALDSWDIDLYYEIFTENVKRNPTNVELFDLAQSNSEHSRHWFFKGRLFIDDVEYEHSLFHMVASTQKTSNPNNVIKFSDNSSGIRGQKVNMLRVQNPLNASSFIVENSLRHIIYTAETHNFPTGVCPFPGAATGTGGRIRDVQAAGRGGHVVAGIAGYAFGNLNIPGYKMPWETADLYYPSNFARALDVCIQASNGASDYGNKFGEPVICGFARSFGQLITYETHAEYGAAEIIERVEYIKPIMFSGGIGMICDEMLKKKHPAKGMLVTKIGGPVYRIGVGGGSASSVIVQGDRTRCESLNFDAVQRGDAQMEQKLNRVIRACLEMGADNPIQSIHDQGAGGNGNVLKEIVEGAGAEIFADNFELGDPTLNALELWGAEYQESNAILIKPQDKPQLISISEREKCPVSFVGEVTGDNRVVLHDFTKKKKTSIDNTNVVPLDRPPVDLNLDWVLGSMPQKSFYLNCNKSTTKGFNFPSDFSIVRALGRVLRLPSVASKRYLTNKVDRSVTGLIAQQQCVGPLHTPLADVAVTALSYFDKVGSAVAVGEQPIKMLANVEAGARAAVGEALTNLVFAPITCLQDVKCSANWMWPAKLSGEGNRLLLACKAMCDVMSELGVAVDGGKDSLSMAARVDHAATETSEVVKSPGTLVVSAYACCTDITKVVTPDLKCSSEKECSLLFVAFGGQFWMAPFLSAGSALVQCYGQVGDKEDVPDLLNTEAFSAAFEATQKLIDGGIICTLLEMAFAGNCGVDVNFSLDYKLIDPNYQQSTFGRMVMNLLNKEPTANLVEVDAGFLFMEDIGILLEVENSKLQAVLDVYRSNDFGAYCQVIGRSVSTFGVDAKIEVSINNRKVISDRMVRLRSMWEQTSYELEKRQCNVPCVESEKKFLETYRIPPLKWSNALEISRETRSLANKFSVAVIREEGSNGDREMAAAFVHAGFEVWDVCMQDLLKDNVTLERFNGLAFVGGFSYADVFGSAKGWASGILFNENLKKQFDWFYTNERKFSFGACNGCQLMARLGWVGSVSGDDILDKKSKVVLHTNDSERFESRFCYVKIDDSPSVMLKHMSGSILGVWVAHGEGKFIFENEQRLNTIVNERLAPVRFVDEVGVATEIYPLNPNGSPLGVAALCSPDGRHLAIMPHPERCFLKWQWPYWPKCKESICNATNVHSPWIRLFENAYEWCSSWID